MGVTWLGRARGLARLASLLVVSGCGGGGLRTVPTGEHPSDATDLTIVDFPPPPAKVEETGRAPRSECAWQDGHWSWVGRRWEWIDGAWVIPPSGCYYAPAVIMVWVSSDRGALLYYGTPRWYRTGGGSGKSKPTCGQPVVCDAEPKS